MDKVRKLSLPTFVFAIILANTKVFAQHLQIDKSLSSWDSTKYHYSFEENKNRLNEIFEVIKKQSDSTHFANYYRRLGTLYKDNGDYPMAFANYIKEADINKNTGNLIASASNLNQIGIIYYRLDNKEKALSFFLKAYKVYEDENSLIGIASAGANVSEIYSDLDSFPKSVYYAQKGLEAMRARKDTAEIDYNYQSLAIVYSKQNQFDSALKYLRKAEKIYPLNHDYKSLIQTYNSIGEVYFTQNEHDSAILYHHKALDTAVKYQNQPLIAETYNYLSKNYEASGDLLNAYHYLKQLKSLDKKLLDTATINYITDAETRYRTREKEREITEQRSQTKLSNLWLVIISIISVVIILIAVLIIISYRSKRQKALREAELHRRRVDDLLQRQEVENVNAMLKGQDEERKRIAQELHDRIGSILSTVKLHFSSVEEVMKALKEQQNKSYNEAVGLLDEAVDEVRRISHDLYEGSLAKFGFVTALRQLIGAIEKANVIKIDFIDTVGDSISYKPFEQDLYRITQELLSNTLKYADAKQVTIQLNFKNGILEYMYEDDGKGFNKTAVEQSSGIGYKNIEARVGKMGGNWFLDAEPNHGMTLTIEIPIQ